MGKVWFAEKWFDSFDCAQDKCAHHKRVARSREKKKPKGKWVTPRFGGRPKAVPANESCCGNVSGTGQLQLKEKIAGR